MASRPWDIPFWGGLTSAMADENDLRNEWLRRRSAAPDQLDAVKDLAQSTEPLYLTPTISSGSSSSVYLPNYEGVPTPTPSRGLGLPSWLSGLAGQGANTLARMEGVPSYVASPLSTVVSGVLGGGEISNLPMKVGYSALKAGANEALPGYGGTLVDLVGGYMNDVPEDRLMEMAGNAVINKGLTAAIPGVGIPLAIASMFGLNPMRGLMNLDAEDPEGGGQAAGFWSPASYGPGVYGGVGSLSTDRAMVPEISTEYVSGLQNRPTMADYVSGSGSSSSYTGGDNSDGSTGYSNPASSYGGW